jgi:hypothetical protein
MSKGFSRRSPALAIACLALFAALGGTVYAANKINGKTIKVKTLPGNRLIVGSVPGNRLKASSVTGDKLAPGSITGAQINTATLGEVPTAIHANNADSARDAETALNAVNAVNALRVNGHTAGCKSPTQFFAGACWQTASSAAAVMAPAAALACTTQGGELPDALSLMAFSQQPGIALAAGDEWSGDVTNLSGENIYAVVTISAAAAVKSALPAEAKKYRCVIPLVT